MKKILSMFFVISMEICLCDHSRADRRIDSEKPVQYLSGDYVYIVLEDGTAEIVEYHGAEEKLSIPDTLDGKSVSSIGTSAFFMNEDLTEVSIPDSVLNIGESAFSACSIEKIALPKNLISIEAGAFMGCNIKTISIPESVRNVVGNPFSACSRLTEINVSPDHEYLAVIDDVLFCKPDKRLICYPAGNPASTYSIPKGIKIIGDSAFSECSNLVSVELPESITNIDFFAFAGCTSLTQLYIPENVTSIGSSCFASCKSLTEISLPEGITSIPYSAFGGCSALSNIVLKGKITNIESKAFSGCTSLTSITLPESVNSISGNPFANCQNLEAVKISQEHPYLDIIDGALISKPDKRLIFYPLDSSSTSYVIPDGIKVIEEFAFMGCKSLTSISIPDSVIDIRYDAFYNCDSLTITVPRDSYALQYCKDNGIRYMYPDSLDWLAE